MTGEVIAPRTTSPRCRPWPRERVILPLIPADAAEESRMIRRGALREYSRGSLWFLPAIAAVSAVMLGVVLSHVPVTATSWLAFQGTADDARSLLITIAGTMVTVIALLLGLAVVALQLSSTQFSPRLLRNFLRDRPNQIVLSVFVGTFVYSAAGLFDVGVSGGQRIGQFPRLAVTVAIALMFVSLAMLVFFADHLAHSLQIDYIMRTVERNTLAVVRTLPAGRPAPRIPVGATPLPARDSGYVQYVGVDRLLALAQLHGLTVSLRPRVGEHVSPGTTLGWVWPASTRGPLSDSEVDALSRSLHALVRMGFERTLEQDPGLGMRQLVDAACKALSPAVNDPYTAIQAIHHLSVIYTELAKRQVGTIVVDDRAGRVCVVVPARSLSEHLDVGMGLIRRYGASEPTVIHALLGALTAVLAAAGNHGEVGDAVKHQSDLLMRAAQNQTREPADLQAVNTEFETLQRLVQDRASHQVS
jgi:uncharacterized membrane protein